MKRFLFAFWLALPAFGQEEPFIVGDAARFHELVPAEARLETLGADFKFTEGPVWIGGDDGHLIFSDMGANELKKWTPAAGFSTYRKPSQRTNGNALDPEGRLISCEQGQRRVARVQPDGSSVAVADNYEGKKLNSPNDLAIRSDGTIWFTDPRYGEWHGPAELDSHCVFRVDGGGTVSIAAKDFKLPNGICLSPDEKILYVGQGGGQNVIYAYDIAADGALANGRKLCTPRQGLPDGFKCDALGNLYITSNAGVEIFTPAGEYLGTIRVQPRPANVAFGGPGRKTLFITAHGCLYRIELKTAGAPPPADPKANNPGEQP
jgi:gluconolactonase